jgi:hypothetical protein
MYPKLLTTLGMWSKVLGTCLCLERLTLYVFISVYSGFRHVVKISHANNNRNKPIKQAVCDRGYVGAKIVLGVNIILRHRHQVRVMNRFCSYLWVVVLIPVGRIRSLFDKFQIGCV